MSLRPLSKELQIICKSELNEVQDNIANDISCLKKWLCKQPHLTVRQDDQWLLAFLRGCKFSLEKTKEKIDAYHSVRSTVPELYSNRDPFSPDIQELLNLGCYLPLSEVNQPTQERVILLRLGLYDSEKNSWESLTKLIFMVHDILLNEDDHFVVAGQHLIEDYTQLTFNHIKHLNIHFVKKAIYCFQQASPIRLKGIHVTKVSPVFDTLFKLIRPLLTEKMKSRIIIYTEKNIPQIFSSVSKNVVPGEYGGGGESIEDLTKKWKQKVESYRDWFMDDYQYRTNENNRSGKTKLTEKTFGAEGSFRKLNID